MVIAPEVPDAVREEKVVRIDLAPGGFPGVEALVRHFEPLVVDDRPVDGRDIMLRTGWNRIRRENDMVEVQLVRDGKLFFDASQAFFHPRAEVAQHLPGEGKGQSLLDREVRLLQGVPAGEGVGPLLAVIFDGEIRGLQGGDVPVHRPLAYLQLFHERIGRDTCPAVYPVQDDEQ